MNNREKVIKGLEEIKEYIREKVNDLGSRKCRMLDKVGDAVALLKEQPEIIRCEDCKWNAGTKEKPYCQIFSMGRRKDWFCADGERKED